jgi:hypothetical protein
MDRGLLHTAVGALKIKSVWALLQKESYFSSFLRLYFHLNHLAGSPGGKRLGRLPVSPRRPFRQGCSFPNT